MENKEQNKPLEAEVRDAQNNLIKKGLVTKLTTHGAYIYDPKEPRKENPDGAEWFAYNAPNGIKTTVFNENGAVDVTSNKL